MSEPHGQDPDRQESSGEPAQQPPASEEPTAQVGWHEPAYAPTQYGQPQPYPGAPQYPQGHEFSQQPTQYGQPGQPEQPGQPGQPGPSGQPGQPGQPWQQPTQYGQPEQPGQYQPPQYGQQYQPTEGYGQPAQYAAPGGPYGEVPPWQAGADKSSRSTLAIVGSIIGVLFVIVVAAVLVTGFWKPGFFITTKLDVTKAQQGVQQILTDQTNGYGVKSADNIKCNNGQDPVVKKDATFTCDVSVDGQHKQVTVTFQDNTGTYEVGRPK
jgi:hypothetical protein